MKHVLLLVAVLLGGCTLCKGRMEAAPVPAASALVDQNGTPIQRVPFKLGVSSATVERMAKQQGCMGEEGAGLVTEPGPVEVYRMRCESGKVFMARCELRQCVKM